MLEAIFDAVVLNKKNFYAEATLSNGKSLVTEHEKLTVGAPVYTLDEEGQPIELSNGSYTTESGIDLEVYDGVLLEYDGEAQAVEDSEVPAEDPVTELDAMKVDFYKALLKTRYAKKFGKGAKNVTLSKMKHYDFYSDIAFFVSAYHGDVEDVLDNADLSFLVSRFESKGGIRTPSTVLHMKDTTTSREAEDIENALLDAGFEVSTL